jgi:hypothetical protein
MNRQETLEWIEIVLDATDRHELMAMIRESLGDFDGEFFKTIDSEVARYETENDQATANRLTEVARTIAALRQNRTESL